MLEIVNLGRMVLESQRACVLGGVLLLLGHDRYPKQPQIIPYFTRLIIMDRVGFEPTTLALCGSRSLG